MGSTNGELSTTDNHVLGFLDSPQACDELVVRMQRNGLPGMSVRTFTGPAGLAALEELLKGSWGEAEQAFYEKSLAELENGHAAIAIAVPDFETAMAIGKLAGPLGGRSFTHFGVMVDTGLET